MTPRRPRIYRTGLAMPRLSVLIPSYNAAPYLPASLDSVIERLGDDDEIVVVDDGSTDDTPAVLGRYASRIRVVQGRHAGLAAARNTALEAASHEWIAFHDADDLAAPDRFDVLLRTLEADPTLDGVFSNGVRMDVPTSPVVPAAMAQRLDGRCLRPVDVFLGFPVYFQSAIVARRAFDRTGAFDESFAVQPDLEYGYRLFERARIRFVNHPSFVWRCHDANMSRNQVGTREDIAATLERVLERNEAIADQIGRRRLAHRLARNWYRLARAYAKRGEQARAARAARRAVELHPLALRYRYLSWQLA